jgi:hypothetical protein
VLYGCRVFERPTLLETTEVLARFEEEVGITEVVGAATSSLDRERYVLRPASTWFIEGESIVKAELVLSCSELLNKMRSTMFWYC